MRTPARVLPVPASRPIVFQTRPMRAWNVLKVAFCAVVLAGAVFGAGYLWPHPERPAAIIEAREEELPAGVTQLYPMDPAWIVRFFDGAGVWREVRMSPDGYEALRAWMKEE